MLELVGGRGMTRAPLAGVVEDGYWIEEHWGVRGETRSEKLA